MDADLNKTFTKKICPKRPKFCSAKCMASLHCSRKLSNTKKYMISPDLSKVINRYNVDIWLKLSFTKSNGSIFVFIACAQPKIWTCNVIPHRCNMLIGPVEKIKCAQSRPFYVKMLHDPWSRKLNTDTKNIPQLLCMAC